MHQLRVDEPIAYHLIRDMARYERVKMVAAAQFMIANGHLARDLMAWTDYFKRIWNRHVNYLRVLKDFNVGV